MLILLRRTRSFEAKAGLQGRPYLRQRGRLYLYWKTSFDHIELVTDERPMAAGSSVRQFAYDSQLENSSYCYE